MRRVNDRIKHVVERSTYILDSVFLRRQNIVKQTIVVSVIQPYAPKHLLQPKNVEFALLKKQVVCDDYHPVIDYER